MSGEHSLMEQRGIAPVPASDQTSRPRDLGIVFLAANLSFTAFVFGWIPITLGLGFADAVLSSVLGIFIGAVISATLALAGPRSRTSNTVSSGAFFGLRGRSIGALITLLVSILYAAVSTWTGGDAITSSLTRAAGLENTDAIRFAGYAVMILAVGVIAIYGHRFLIRAQSVLLIILIISLILIIAAIAPTFDASYAGGEYVLGDYFPTFMLAVAIAASGPLSYAPYLSDYTRYVSPDTHSSRSVWGWAFGALFVSLLVAGVIGSAMAVVFIDPFADFVPGIVESVPAWGVLPLLIFGIVGGISQGSVSLYDAGLQVQALTSRVKRVSATIGVVIASAVLVIIGTAQTDTASTVSAAVLALNAILVPWIVISALGYVRTRGAFDVEGLQGGTRYWFSGGWNLPAVTSWLVGSFVAIMFLQTETWFGPWAEVLSGVDVSIGAGIIVSGVLYLLLGAATKQR